MRLALVLVLVLAACSAPDEVRAPSPVPSPPTAPLATADAPAPELPPDAEPPPDAAPARAARIELTFVGDLMFGGYFDDHYDPQYVEKHDPLVEMDALLASDLPFGNLETTIARSLPNGGGPHDGKGHKRFVTLPERVAVLARHGLRTVTLANNHQYDNDDRGLTDTVAILGELGIAHVGAARAEPPRLRVETIDVRGWRVGFVAITTQMNRVPRASGPLLPYVRDGKLVAEAVPVITAARADHDLVVVVIHWGYEYQDAPARWQLDAAHAFVDAGAAAVIGHHPHVLQGIERYKDAVIAYSLGNFVFPNGKERIRETGVLRLGFATRASAAPCLDVAAFHPAIQVRQPITHPVIPSAAQRAMIAKRFFALSAARPLATTWKDTGERFETAAVCPR